MTKEGLLRLLNVRDNESPVVFRLLAIQFALGLATAFLTSGSLSLFLYTYPVTYAPEVFILGAIILFPLNALYARADLKLNSKKLLQISILFASISMAITLGLYEITHAKWLVIVMAAWNLSLYMIIGYAYWGLAALLFNVRESRRIFSVIGAGDLPAKAIGYLAVSLFSHTLGLDVMMGASIIFFTLAFYLCKKLFSHSAINWERFENEQHHVSPEKVDSWWMRLFENKLIQWISVLSIISYIALYLFDYTFLSQVKVRFHSEHDLAKFISLFFASGRLLAIIVKLVLSSRLIARLGLSKALLITPITLLIISIGLIAMPAFKMYEGSYLYGFGILVLISEVLRSTVQEPVFFILFQPLNIHLRLKGHLVTKGYVLPPALIIVGASLAIYLHYHESVSIPITLLIACALFVAWMASILKVDKEYLHAVQRSIQRGFFTGVALFLDDEKVIKTLLGKINTGKTGEKLHALHLLEKSGYNQFEELLAQLLETGNPELRFYVLGRIEHKRYTNLAKTVEEFYKNCNDPELKRAAYQTACMIDEPFFESEFATWENEPFEKQKSLLVCVAKKEDHEFHTLGVRSALQKMANSADTGEQSKLLEILDASSLPASELLLNTMAGTPMAPHIYRQWIAVAGKIGSANLLPQLLQALSQKEFRTAAMGALHHMKETVFESGAIASITDREVLELLAAIAAKTKTSHSAGFLLNMLEHKQLPVSEVAGSLWQQQYIMSDENNKILSNATDDLIEHLTMKYNLLLEVDHKHHKLLADAINSEIETELMALLQLLALQYGRKQLARVIELVEMKQFSKIHNAIELLELSIPRKLFNQVVELVDHLTGDPGKIVKNSQRKNFIETAETVLSHSKHFNDWTKSVIWWMAGKEPDKNVLPKLAAYSQGPDSPILKETKEFVIFSHNHKSD